MLKKLSLSVCILLSTSTLSASEYSKWLEQQNQSFYNYKKSLDDEFSEMLKKQWQEYKTMYKNSEYKKPKPKILPVVKKIKKIPKKDLIKSIKVKPKKIVIKKELPKSVVIKKFIKKGYISEKIDFYNQDIKITYDKKFKYDLYSVNNNSIGDSWKKLSKTDYKSLIKQINLYTIKYSLNDWAKYQLIYKLGKTIYHNKNQANIFTWFIFTKMGYDTKVAYSNNKIYLLANIKQKLYQVSQLNINNKKYHILTPNGKINISEAIFTYDSSYKKSKKRLSFDMNKHEIGLFTNIDKKNLDFKYNNKDYKLTARYSKDLLSFYKTFPQSQYDLYYKAKNSPAINNSLLLELKPLIKGKTELEGVNFLLRFVQTAFAYKTDQEQFSYEKVFFPEETIYYPFSDCEDRSIMFSYLVKNLLGLDVVAVKYDDHMSAAVNFSSKVNGDGFVYHNKRYIMADPTYINANVGMTMPIYKKRSFSIINQSLF